MSEMYDVVIVGYGPTGQTFAALMASKGYRIAVVERWPEVFPLPRAGHVDHEVMRILQAVGVADDIAENSWKLTHYEFLDANSEVLHAFDWGYEAKSGWYSDYSLFQPHLEGLLHDQVARHPQVDFFRGWRAESVADHPDHVAVQIRRGSRTDADSWSEGWTQGTEAQELRARYVVGCDGANSLVRTSSKIEMDDFGFEADWLVIFADPADRSLVVDMPDMAQILDPKRPTTAFRASGNRFCRWEFMLMPGETVEQMSTPEAAWGLIARWGLNPDNARLVRNTVFRFRSLVAHEWRSGRAFLVGDAAHLMPPFMGQGMCSGLRDAKTLAWKLDLVLSGRVPEALLDTYGLERREHVAEIVEASLRTGQMISITDPQRAKERDDMLRSGKVSPPSPLPGLADGILARTPSGELAPHAGLLSMQPWIEVNGARVHADDVLGHGWTVVATGWDPRSAMSADAHTVVDSLEASVGRIETDDTAEALKNTDGTFAAWLAELVVGPGAVIIRPDFYVFAAVSSPEELDAALIQLGQQLGLSAHAKAPVA
ncbi:MAG: 2-polyprenyl-6-methoxyphenol hydroxylase-related FAD-dependent oxidoreductase [Nocardioidaceae bacterium]|nr:2-polyprenyl-6-methoxyphenol hydroxylase-related FAD-dependent oxidoreductase [Nocardioidaceae bacterium]